VKVAILAKKPFDISQQIALELEERGHSTTIYHTDDLLIDHKFLEYDLVVQKSKQMLFLYAGIYAKVAGISVVPDPERSLEIRDRIRCQALITGAGLRAPFFYFGFPHVLAEKIPSDEYPLVCKRQFGSRGQFVSILDSPETLAGAQNDTMVYLQQYIEGKHFLVCFIDSEIRMYEKKMLQKETSNLQEVPVPDEVVKVVSSWRRVTDLPLGDLDIVQERATGDFWVVDPGSFPNFLNWPGAAAQLAETILMHAAMRQVPLD
ncbi:MAG TPA: hypothetical protein VKK79_16715, partial [Candidatus Lokiarchaeia archaeon]|nr:hypothetical protein [Candidatus Lokiarchaeia archaeon]